MSAVRGLQLEVKSTDRARPVGWDMPARQIESLEQWAELLKPGMVVGVRAAGAGRHLEGPVWLLLVESEAFPVPEDLVHSSAEQLVESTALVVPRAASSALGTAVQSMFLGCWCCPETLRR